MTPPQAWDGSLASLTFILTFHSLRKQLTFHHSTTDFPAKWCLRNKRRNSILMVHEYTDLGSASDWLKQISHAARPIRSTTQICDQSKVLPRSVYWCTISMEFLRLFLRRHFAGKPVVISQNVGCFLRLDFSHPNPYIFKKCLTPLSGTSEYFYRTTQVTFQAWLHDWQKARAIIS